MVEYHFFEINKMSIGYSKVSRLEIKLRMVQVEDGRRPVSPTLLKINLVDS